MGDAPERIWALWPERGPEGRWAASALNHDDDGYSSYVREDLHAAAIAERDALRAEVERLREAVRGCLRVLDATISESGRGIEWGEEDAFRMGEWFEDEDIAAVEAARAALGDSKP